MPDPAVAAQLAAAAEQLAAGRFGEARQMCERLLARHPGEPEVLHLAGLACFRTGDADTAIDYLTRSLELQPESADVLANLGQIQFELGNHEAAQSCFAAALDLAPDDHLLRFRYALTLHQLAQYREAEAELRTILRAHPGDVPALYNLGLALAAQGRTPDAIATYEEAARYNPLEFSARTQAESLRLEICEWSGLARVRQEIVEPALRAGITPRPPLPLDLIRLPVPISAGELHALTVNFARGHGLVATPRFAFPPAQSAAGRRLRVGYVSSDFGDHPVGHVVGPLLSHHDRRQVEVIAYALTPRTADAEQASVARSVDRVVDLSKASAGEAAQRINADGVDILVDLNGHTLGNRLELFALRPAPVQVTWLGYPGTTGTDFIDYAIVDERIAPAGEQAYFTERLVHVPETYFAVAVPPAEAPPPRITLGLPERGVVFGAFTLSRKIEPVAFGAWMRLLQRVPGSVLWLRLDNPLAIENLKREAAARGIGAERLVFAPRVPRAEHLRRQRAADLMLDTLFYNGHSTTAETLALGVPVVAMRGDRLAARVSAGLLDSIGLSDLVGSSPEEYEAIAARLAGDPAALADAKRRLAAAQRTAPLFDPPRFVRHLEAGYRAMWETYAAGRAPQPIRVPPVPR